MTDQILTEEELKELYFNANERNRSGLITGRALDDMFKVIKSHRSLLSANAELAQTVVKQNSANLKLVYENDELMAENVKYKDALEKIEDLNIQKDDSPSEVKIILRLAETARMALKPKSEELNHE